MTMNIYYIAATEDTPLMSLLVSHLPNRHRSHIPALISSGGVWRDRQRITDPAQVIKKSETLKIYIEPGQELEYLVEPEHVVYENQDFLIVYKPGGVNVHAVPSTTLHHLAYGVDRYLEQKGIVFRSTPLTRLDMPVSGLVLFAAHKVAEKRLFRLIKRRRIKKWYLAALEKNSKSAGELGQKFIRLQDRVSSRDKRTAYDPDGKFADSLFAYRGERGGADIYSVFTFTGRRHQIRYHASRYLAPILGDRLYHSEFRYGNNEIALLCYGYNIPFGGRHYRIRLPEKYLDEFYAQIAAAKHQGVI